MVTRARLAMLFAAICFALGCTDSFELGRTAYFRGDHEEAVRLWRPPARAGRPDAQHFLGYAYLEGHGVDRDYNAAATWFRRSADQGYAMAQFALATMYHQGRGIEQDFSEAYFWFSLADAGGVQRSLSGIDICAARMDEAQILDAERRLAAWSAVR